MFIGPKQILSSEGRLCRDCLFMDAIKALPRLPSPECDDGMVWYIYFFIDSTK